KGLLDMRNNVLPDLADQVGELAGKFADTINAAHNASTAYPPPASLTGNNTGLLSTDLQGFTGKTEFAALDSSGKVVNSVTIDFGAMPAGSTIADVVNAVNAGLGGAATMSFNNGVMSFTGAGGNKVATGQVPGAGSDRGGHGFSQFFGLNDLVTAAVPSNFDTGFSATDANGFTPGGTMSLQLIGPGGDIASSYNLTMAGGSFNTILSDLNANMGGKVTFSMDSNGALVETPAPGYEGYGIHVVSDSTSRGATGTSFSQLFGLGNPYTADAANGLGVTSTITNDQNRVALGTLDTTAAVGNYALAAGDNSGAQALANVANQTVNFADFGDLKSIHGTLNQYAAMVLSNAGLKAAQADQLTQDAQSLSQEINQRQSDASGVNLDEELSNMIVYQNAYAAAGRVIKTAQDVYNSLLQAVS
ncbi:MAG TPA: flagellar basal body rod C-terminal domain-containing protein, partial [Alphaproteobacteria bacterium]|nr:flagellar basal body rod C-terminal domain-containing protein [Alphaproteobacteria bacterium]